MTIKELSQLYYLEKLIERDNRAIEQIEERLTAISPVLSGMPHGGGANDKIGNGVPELVDLKAELQQNVREADKKRLELRNYIDTIEDIKVRLICVHRFIDLMSWQAVSDALGDDSTEASVKMLVVRYFQQDCKEVEEECTAQSAMENAESLKPDPDLETTCTADTDASSAE